MKALPLVSGYDHPFDGRLVFIKRFEPGYWEKGFLGVVSEELDAAKWNKAHNVTRGQAEAMFMGSTCGWGCAAAQPESWSSDGGFIHELDD